FHIARECTGRKRDSTTGSEPSCLAERGKAACVGALAESIEQPSRTYRRCWLRQDGELPDDFGGDVEDSLHALEIRLALGPRLLCCEIAIGIGYHCPNNIQVLLDGLPVHGLASFAVEGISGAQDRPVGIREDAGRGDLAIAVLG